METDKRINLRITNNPEEANLITHDGTFHPDDVFSTMFLSNIIKDPVLYRASVKNIPKNNKAIIYDIGFGKFDHHGPDARYRQNSSLKYCSFGLLWEEYGYEFLKSIDSVDTKALFNRVVEKLIKQIDAIDNGIFPKIEAEYQILDLDKIIDMFNNTWEDTKDNNDNFLIAVNIAQMIFERLVKRENSIIKATKIVEDKIDTVKDNILILDESMPYNDAIFNSKNKKSEEIKVIISPSNRGGYNIKPRTITRNSKELVVNFPKEYHGLHDQELANISHIKTATFIHSTGFLGCSETLSDAILLAKSAINNKDNI